MERERGYWGRETIEKGEKKEVTIVYQLVSHFRYHGQPFGFGLFRDEGNVVKRLVYPIVLIESTRVITLEERVVQYDVLHA